LLFRTIYSMLCSDESHLYARVQPVASCVFLVEPEQGYFSKEKRPYARERAWE
jgi:hypothetical protein